jgi:hypothetical protein
MKTKLLAIIVMLVLVASCKTAYCPPKGELDLPIEETEATLARVNSNIARCEMMMEYVALPEDKAELERIHAGLLELKNNIERALVVFAEMERLNQEGKPIPEELLIELKTVTENIRNME